MCDKEMTIIFLFFRHHKQHVQSRTFWPSVNGHNLFVIIIATNFHSE